VLRERASTHASSSPTEPTATAAATAVGCEAGDVVKSLVFMCDGLPVMALVPGDRRADELKVAAPQVDLRRVARPEEVVAATGLSPAR
jgi:prolyl-tRNA editing enzyme YbaK/EbsC (Cys-tRNA(Pro) deacylase)